MGRSVVGVGRYVVRDGEECCRGGEYVVRGGEECCRGGEVCSKGWGEVL